MEAVELGPRSINDYTKSAGPGAVTELRRLAEPFRGVRVLHVNSTPKGGGQQAPPRLPAPTAGGA